jgi:phage tail protein X
MPAYYKTKEGDVLDWICWKYYVQKKTSSMISQFPSDQTLFLSPFMTTQDVSLSGINWIIEKVLVANPGLSQYVTLPPGMEIFLPDIQEQMIDQSVTHLWE